MTGGERVEGPGKPDEPTLEEIEASERPGRPWREFARVLIVLAIVILILLMFRGCGGSSGDTPGADDGNTIESVEGAPSADGMISLWIAAGADIDDVLAEAGVSSSGHVDMDDGHYVVTVPDGSEAEAVAGLKTATGVIDAGLVYDAGDEPDGGDVTP